MSRECMQAEGTVAFTCGPLDGSSVNQPVHEFSLEARHGQMLLPQFVLELNYRHGFELSPRLHGAL